VNRASLRATVNGETVDRDVLVRQTLAEFLRDSMGLTGTKISCEMQVCGACTVLVDGNPVSACTLLAVDIEGRDVVTIEGIGTNDELHPVQQAFVDSFGLQCGFCTPGFVMMSVALLERHPDPSAQEIAEYLEGNICRCTGYRPIAAAVALAARRMQGTGP
jgi:aerobic-type carbon monoxide dehydrogenase small subunit (CoxS/CutS family)